MKERVLVVAKGKVQGVFYRASARDQALDLGLTGWVKNLPNGRVQAVAEGPRDLLDRFVEWCRVGPTFARVDDVDVQYETYLAEFMDFRVVG